MVPNTLEFEVSRISKIRREELPYQPDQGDKIAVLGEPANASVRLERDSHERPRLVTTTTEIGGIRIPVIDTPVASGGGWSLMVEYVVSNEWTSFPAILRGLLRNAAGIKGAFLEWESGVPVLQLVVDRSNEDARNAAYDAERNVGRALQNVNIRFRLLDVTDVEEAKMSGLRPLFIR